MAQHKDLTGDDLHEPKGLTSAPVGSVYVANGGGTGTWKKVGKDQIDSTGITGLTTRTLTLVHPNIKTANKAAYRTVQVPGSLIRIAGIIDGVPTEDVTLAITKNGTINIASVVIASGSPEGSQIAAVISPGVNFVQGDYIKVLATGGAGGAQTIIAALELVFAN